MLVPRSVIAVGGSRTPVYVDDGKKNRHVERTETETEI